MKKRKTEKKRKKEKDNKKRNDRATMFEKFSTR